MMGKQSKAGAAQFDPLRIYIQAERFLFTDEKLRGPGLISAEVGYVMVPCLVM